jgi:uncharacterized membrane protein YphA (DoxX/SURF4 family)
MLSSMFITGGVNSLKNSDYLARQTKPVTDKLGPAVDRVTERLPFQLDSKQMVQLNGVVHVVGGFCLATGRAPRLSALALAATLVPTTFGGHRFWEENDPQQKANQKIHFFKNVSMMGGLLLASVDTAGKPSLAWRAKDQASKTRHRASRLTPG